MAARTSSAALVAVSLSLVVVFSVAGIGIGSADAASIQGHQGAAFAGDATSPPGNGNGGPPDGRNGREDDEDEDDEPGNGNGPPPERGPPTTIESCTVIDSPGRYFLGDDVRTEGSGACIRITSSNVVLDGKRNTIAGTKPGEGTSIGVHAGETGPNSTTLTDVTVRNLFVRGTSTGVAFENVRDGLVQASGFSGHFFGIRLTGTDARDNRIVANRFTGTTRGLSIEWGSNNLVAGNHGSNNLVGVYLSHSSENKIRGNTIVDNNEVGVALEDDSVDNEIRNNSVWDNEEGAMRMDNSSEENDESDNDEDKPTEKGEGRGNGQGQSDRPWSYGDTASVLPATAGTGFGGAGLAAMASTSVGFDAQSSVAVTDGAGFQVADVDAMADSSVSFNVSGLANVSLSFPTSLQFGPDGRLYVSEQYGLVHALTVERNASGDYVVTDSETITKVQTIPNHDDDGSLNTSVNGRLVTGLLVAGTAENPVLYVTSSDPRIGGGEAGTDTPVDTNSGMVSRLTWNGTAWNHTELVRGLPRSEENHGPNGMALDESTDTLYLAMGGNTDKGAPSANFAYLPEYAYSAAILSINLTEIGDTTYDLPTLQNTSTPFGGQEGDNMAKIVNGSPVQIYSPGYRNPYDLVLTEDDQLYTIDNGANSGWGGPPVNEGPAGECTNEPNENNSESYFDSLHYIPEEGFYAGHPAPVRGNPDGSGYPGAVPTADPVQCDLIKPGNGDGSLTKFAASTNGIDEYTASTFDGVMQGDLLAAGFSGNLWRLQLTSDGTTLSSKSALFSNFGSKPLDVTAQGDGQVFPGTIWAATYGSEAITVFDPNENFDCTGADNPALDEDDDGYSNADEIDAGTNPCSEGSAPADFDGDDFSNLNDYDDDNDAWSDISDPFAVDARNGLGTTLPVTYDLAPGSEVGTILDLGFTGLMTNGEDDYRDLYDPSKLTAGGAANVLTVDAVTEGDAYRANNDQEYGFQFGLDPEGQRFTVHTKIKGPFTSETAVVDNQSQGFFVGNGDQDNYVKLVAGAKGGSGGIHFLREVDGTTTTVAYPTVPNVTEGSVNIDLYMTVDPRNDTVTGAYAVNGSTTVTVGTTTVPGNWISSAQQGLATGVVGTSRGPGDPFPGTWKRIEASEGTVLSGNQPPAAAFDYAPPSPTVDETVTFDASASTDDDGSIDSYAWDLDGDGAVDQTGQQVTTTYTATGERTVSLTVTDDDTATDSVTRTVNVTDGTTTVVSENVTSCGIIDSPGQYTLTADILDSRAKPCLQVTASDVVLDGDGHTMAANASAEGSTLRAVYVGQTGLDPGTISNVTVRDLVLTNWSTGVYYRRADGGRVLGNSIDGAFFGVHLDGSEANRNHTVENNVVTDTGRGIVLEGTEDSWVAGNDLSRTDEAVELLAVTNTDVVDTTATGTAGSALRLDGSGPDNRVTNLTVDGTTVSFTGRNVTVGPVGSPPTDPDGQDNIGKRVATAATGTEAFVDLSLRYTDADVGLLNESTLSMWTYDGAWTELSGVPHVDTGANLVSVNTTQFGVLTPLADENPVVYRVNAGGNEVESTDGDLNWSADTLSSPSTYTNQGGANSKVFDTTDPIQVDSSVPSSTPAVVFKTERWDPTSEGEMQWDFPVTAGATYEVRLYFAEIYWESADQRLFDTTLEMEGTPVLDSYDIYADVGHDTGVMKSFTVTPDSTLDVDFAHVTDNPKLSAIEIVKVADSDGNQPPTASFTYSPSSPTVNETVTFDASSSSDPDGSISSYAWDVDGDGTAEYNGQQVTHTYTTAGDRTVTLTVNDDDGATSTASQTVTVAEPDTNQPPTASFTYSPSSPTVNETVTFDASGSSDSDGNISSYAWDVDGDGTVEYNGQQASHTYTTTGDRTVTLTVTDDDGANDTASQTVTVVEPTNGTVVYRVNAGGSQLAAADGGPDWSADTSTSPSTYTNPSDAGSGTYSTNDAISLTGSVPSSTPTEVFQTERFDPSSGAEMQWDFPVTSGATYEVRLYFAEIYFQNSSERVFDTILEMEGTPVLDNYDIYADVGHDTGVMKAFTVTPDDNLDVDFDHVVQNPKLSAIEIVKTGNATGNTGPTASFTYSPSNPVVNETVTFDASGSSDSDGSISSYEWDVDGDGTAEYTGETATHNYTTTGDRTVTLTVTDDDGATNTTSQTVTVVESDTNQPPTASFTYSPTGPTVNETVSFDASGSSDPDGSISSYEWDVDGDGTAEYNGQQASHTYTTTGDRTVALTVTDDDGATNNTSRTVTVVEPTNGTVVYRVNAGGAELESTDGDLNWSADTSTSPSTYTNPSNAGSSTYSTTDTISLTGSVPSSTPTEVFQTERFDPSSGAEMQWDFPVTSGATYEVRLYFAEIYFQNASERVFDTTLEMEGTPVLDNYDIYADVGHDTGVMKSFTVTPDSTLDIDFDHVAQNPKLSAIEIVKTSNATGNTAPSASFTYSPSDPVVNETVSFDASGSSDSDGSISSYEWDVDGDGTAEYTGETATHTYTTTGDRTVTLTVTDDDGATDTASQTVTVAESDTNQPPTASFTYSPSSPTVNETVSFNASDSSDSDGSISSYTWDVDGDGTTEYNGQQATHTYTTTGDRTVTLTVTDDDGANDTAGQTVTVVEETNGTVVYRVNAGGTQLAAADGGPDWSADTPTSPSTYTNPSDAGSGTYSTTDAISLTSSVPTGTPTEVFQTERFDPSSGAEMQWDFPVTSGATYEVRLYFAEIYFQNASERVFDTTLEMEGTPVLDNYDIYADVGHDTGVMKSFSVTPDSTLDIDFDHVVQNPKLSAIEIIKTGNATGNTAPTASFTYSPSNPVVNETVTFDASGSSDSDGSINSYAWDVDGDGNTEYTGETATHTYTTTGDRTVTLTVTDDDGATDTASQTVTVDQPTTLTAEAEIAITPNSNNINDSTFGAGSFVVTNTGEANISTVRLNLSTAVYPDMVFDPNGTAGDNFKKGFEPNDASGINITGHSFLEPHEGNENDGYDVLEITFGGFEPGETLTFASDVDPNSIKGDGAPGPYEAGSVSGLELSRSDVTVAFETGATHVGALFSDGSLAGSQAVVKNDTPSAPSLGVRNVSLQSTTLSPGHTAANVTDASQTVVVSGPSGATVRLLRAEGGQFTEGVPDGGYDVETFEANSVVEIQEQTVSLGADGTANASVTLTNSTSDVNNGTAGYNYFVAVVEDASGDTGLASDVIVLRLNDTGSGSTASLVSPDSLGVDATRTAPSTRTGPAPTGSVRRSLVPAASARGR